MIVGINRYPRPIAQMAPGERERTPFSTHVIVDGMIKEYSAIAVNSFVFSPIGDSYAFAVVTDPDEHRYIVNGKPSPPFKRTAPGVFSSDGTSFAFGALDAND